MHYLFGIFKAPMEYGFIIEFVQRFREIAGAGADEVTIHHHTGGGDDILFIPCQKDAVEPGGVDVSFGKAQGVPHGAEHRGSRVPAQKGGDE